MFPQLFRFTDLALLLMRLMVAAVFVTSGWGHSTHSKERSQSIGMSQGFTRFLGLAELAGGAGVALGVWPQLAAIGLILIMLGAIQKKIFAWHIAFWANNGWNYEVMMIVMNLVIAATGGGRYGLRP